jgi:hypothetical protein
MVATRQKRRAAIIGDALLDTRVLENVLTSSPVIRRRLCTVLRSRPLHETSLLMKVGSTAPP